MKKLCRIILLCFSQCCSLCSTEGAQRRMQHVSHNFGKVFDEKKQQMIENANNSYVTSMLRNTYNLGTIFLAISLGNCRTLEKAKIDDKMPKIIQICLFPIQTTLFIIYFQNKVLPKKTRCDAAVLRKKNSHNFLRILFTSLKHVDCVFWSPFWPIIDMFGRGKRWPM